MALPRESLILIRALAVRWLLIMTNTNTNDKTASVNKQTSGSPKTGDNANTVFWVLLEIMAAFAVIVNVKNKKRKEL